MKKPFVLAAIAGAIAFPFAGNAVASNDRNDGGRTLVLHVVSDQTVPVDVNPTGGAGDEIVFNENLYKNNNLVGSDAGVCTQTPNPDNNHYLCNVTFDITNRGQITVDGIINFADTRPVIPIVGGTGEFRAAKGEFDFTTQSPTTFTDTFRLTD
jgi:hypothetical protein